MAGKKDSALIAEACKRLGVKQSTLKGYLVNRDRGLVSVVLDDFKKHTFTIEELSYPTQKATPITVKVDKPPETALGRGKAPDKA